MNHRDRERHARVLLWELDAAPNPQEFARYALGAIGHLPDADQSCVWDRLRTILKLRELSRALPVQLISIIAIQENENNEQR